MSRFPGLALAALLPGAISFSLACVEPSTTADADVDAHVALDDAGHTPDAGPAPDAFRAPDAGPPEDLEAAIDYWTEAGGLAGVAALAADDDTRIVVTSGMANETDEVGEHTLFNVASISKTFVAALALSLAEDGLLDLDAPLSEVMPDLPIVHPDHPEVAITTRMLLTHTSGLIDEFLVLGDYTEMNDPSVDLETFTREYVSQPSRWGPEPGTAREYCNAGYGVLGLVITRASGRDLRELSRERLFDPLALDGAGWFFADVDAERLATGYTRTRTGYTAQPNRNYAFYPATSLMISVAGLERWLRFHLDEGVLDGERYLEASSIEQTRTAQFPALDDGQYLTWYSVRQGGERWIGHSGSSYGTSAQARYRPEERRILVVLSSSDAYIRARVGNEEGSNAIRAILDRLERELETR